MFGGTRDVAANATNAATAYQRIANATNEAMAAAKDALAKANQAFTMVSSGECDTVSFSVLLLSLLPLLTFLQNCQPPVFALTLSIFSPFAHNILLLFHPTPPLPHSFSTSPLQQTNGLSGRAGESAQRSATLLQRARDLKRRVDETLWTQLEEARRMVKEAVAGNDEVESRLALITGDINGLPNGKSHPPTTHVI